MATDSWQFITLCIGGYVVMGWLVTCVMVVAKARIDDPVARIVVALLWPWAVVAGTLIGIGHLFILSTRPADAFARYIRRYKCEGCDRRVPWSATYCPWCSRKMAKEGR